MATNYTANYGLCQWEPQDSFTHTEFNQDNAKIDAALAEKADAAEVAEQLAAAQEASNLMEQDVQRALKTVPPMGYDLVNLALQGYYDNKASEFFRGIAFDGFRDTNRLAWVGRSTWVKSDPRCLFFDCSTLQEYEFNDGGLMNQNLQAGQSSTVTWTAPGTADVTAALLNLTGSGTLAVSTDTGGTLATAAVTGNSSAPISFRMERGTTYHFRFTANTQTTLHGGFEGLDFGIRLTVTNVVHAVNGMWSKTFQVGRDFTRLHAWVRHNSNWPDLISVRMGPTLVFQHLSDRQTVNHAGQSCWESEFSLDLGSQARNGFSLAIDLVTYPSYDMEIYDYGVVAY